MRALFLLSLLSLACEPLDELIDAGPSAPVQPEQVAGSWVIHGEGRMSACEEAQYNSDSLRFASQALRVRQDEAQLSLDRLIEGFQFEGQVLGEQVYFSTQETHHAGSILISFEGRVEHDGVIRGGFTGSGPSGCQSSGSFHVAVTPLATDADSGA